MPPAFVLSQNQTLKLMYDPTGGNTPGRPASPGAVPAQIYKLVCLRIRTLAPHPSIRPGGYLWNGINLTDHPEPGGSRRPGRRPHVPSSKPTMSKSRRVSTPGSIAPGIGYTDKVEARNGGRPKGSATACWGCIYGSPPIASTAFCAISRTGHLSRLGNRTCRVPR